MSVRNGYLNRIFREKRSIILMSVFSFFFALSWTFPSYTGGASLKSCLGEAVLLTIPLFFLFAALVWVVNIIREVQVSRASGAVEQESCTGASEVMDQYFLGFRERHKIFLVVFAITFLVWFVVYLICYPGIFSADSSDIIRMVSGAPFESSSFRYSGLNDHHPLLYSFLSWLILSASELCGASLEFSVGLLSFFHMLCLALSCSYCASTLYAVTGSKWTIVLCVLALSFNPLVALYAITVWKDVLFGSFSLAFAERDRASSELFGLLSGSAASNRSMVPSVGSMHAAAEQWASHRYCCCHRCGCAGVEEPSSQSCADCLSLRAFRVRYDQGAGYLGNGCAICSFR